LDTLPHEKQIRELEATIEQFRKKKGHDSRFSHELLQMEKQLQTIKKKIYESLSPWERVTICRHPNRPHTINYIKNICDHFTELHGDRHFSDDKAVIGGLARIGPMNCVLIGQEKGNDTESRVKHNFGMLQPDGFRKALRLMHLAEKFHLPVVTLLDTPGAFPGLEAEERGQGWAIAMNLREMARLATPIIVVVIGEGCSGGALGMGVGDRIGMLEHSYYSVISPEGCAAILWKDASKNQEAATALKLNSENLQQFSIIDTIIPEPLGGAHHNPKETCEGVKKFLIDSWNDLQDIPTKELLQLRYEKFRSMGSYQVTAK
jgi:acetyl-CoA carboxylase carboxyl transferase subunit alpha